MAAEDTKKSDTRLLIISNRLPLTIKRTDDGQYNFSMSSGGLVTGLSGLSKTMSYEWYGWPGLEVPEGEIDLVKDRLKKECDAHPVFVDDDLADKHYNGFSSMISQHTRLFPSPFSNLCFLQMKSSGPSSTTTPVRSPLTSPLGLPTTRSTLFSQRRLPQMSRMVT